MEPAWSLLDVCHLGCLVESEHKEVTESCQESKRKKRDLVDDHNVPVVLIFIA